MKVARFCGVHCVKPWNGLHSKYSIRVPRVCGAITAIASALAFGFLVRPDAGDEVDGCGHPLPLNLMARAVADFGWLVRGLFFGAR